MVYKKIEDNPKVEKQGKLRKITKYIRNMLKYNNKGIK